ncbi:MAG: DNA polymerase III subunit gamma/tau [Bacteroidales bacterium]
MNDFVVSARKYRPQVFSTVIGQKSITETLKNSILRKHLAHAYLFCGPRGVGKTTCARIFAKTINCLTPTPDMEACNQCESCQSFNENRSYSIHELDAASNNSVDNIRALIEKVRIPPQVGQYSVYIIDEVHMLSTSAFNAFLKTLEEPPEYAIFILATTEKHKILPTILSRCQIYDFNRIRIEDTVQYLQQISAKEEISVEDAALNIIAQKADGAMRDALSIFDQLVSFCGNSLTYAQVIATLNVLDYEYYFQLTNAFLQNNYVDALMVFDSILNKGFDAQHFIAGLCTHFRNLLVCKDIATIQLLESSESVKQDYSQQAQVCTIPFLFEALKLANACDVNYKQSGNPRLHVELCLLQITELMSEKKKNSTSVNVEEIQGEISKTPTISSHSLSQPAIEATPIVDSIVNLPTPTEPIKSIQIKDILKGNLKTGLESIVSAEINPKEEFLVEQEQNFTMEQLKEAISLYAESLSEEKIRLKNALQTAHYFIEENHIVGIEVVNTLLHEELTTIDKLLSQYLIRSLQNKNIHLKITIEQEIPSDAKPYTPEQCYKALVNDFPELELLRKNLDMSIL